MTWLVGDKPVSALLVTRLRYLGDVVMSTVVCEALRAGDPQLRIGYLCEAAHGEILADQPHISRLHLLGVARRGADARARGTTATTNRAGDANGVLRGWPMIRELRRARYDAAVDLFFNPRSAWLLWMSGIGVRIGGTRRWRRHLYTHTVLRDDVNEAAPQLPLLAPGGLGEHMCRLAPLTHAESGQDFLSWIGDHFAPGQLRPQLRSTATPLSGAEPYFVLAPGATWPAKEWSVEQWRGLVQALASAPGPRLKILIPPGRTAQWGGLAAGLPASRVEVLPEMSLPAIKDLLAGAAALVSVDGGVMHMAVALGRPTLALFGPTDPEIWFPYESMGPFRVVALAPDCHPCDRHHCDAFVCLPELSVARVLAELQQLLGPTATVAGSGAP
jgi:heptosyltransferase-1